MGIGALLMKKLEEGRTALSSEPQYSAVADRLGNRPETRLSKSGTRLI
jgi:hypothetical protein